MNVIAGNGTLADDPTTQLATKAPLNYLRAVATAPDKTIYIAESDRIRRIRPDGQLELVAKTRNLGPGLDLTNRFVLGSIYPDTWAVAKNGDIYFRLSVSSFSALGSALGQGVSRPDPGQYFVVKPDATISKSGDSTPVTAQFLPSPDGEVYFRGIYDLNLFRANRTAPEPVSSSDNLPTTLNAAFTTARSGFSSFSDLYTFSLDARPRKLKPIPALVGGPSIIAATPSGDLYLRSSRNTFLLRRPQDCPLTTPPVLPAGGLVNAANFGYRNKISPGQLFTLFGQNLITGPAVSGVLDGDLYANSSLAGVFVKFLRMVYASPSQVTAIASTEFNPQANTFPITYGKDELAYPYPDPVQIVEATPALFTAGSTGSGQAASLNQDGRANSAANPIARGQVIQLYGTGFGTFEGIDIYSDNQYGRIATPPYPKLTLPVKIKLGDREATVEYAGAAPGLLLGIVQINIRIPADAPTGPSIPLTIRAGSTVAEQSVTIAIK